MVSTKFMKPLVSLIAVFLTLIFFPSSTVFLANVQDFSIGLWSAAAALLLVGFAISTLFALAAWMVSESFRAAICALLLVLAIGAWAQANIFIWNYGLLDGRDIAWSEYTWHGVLELLVWLSLLYAGYRFSASLYSHAYQVSAVLIVVQLIPFGLALLSAPAAPSHHEYRLNDEQKFSFSKDENLVLFVVDAFQADVFQEILDNEPMYQDAFAGFIFFRNAVSGYAKTYPSIPLMLTGRWYENERPIVEFMREAFMGASLPKDLKREGWDVRLYPSVNRIIHFHESIADNIQPMSSLQDQIREAGTLVDVGIFRAIPHFLKNAWLNDYEWQVAPRLEALVRQERPQAEVHAASKHRHPALRWLEDMQAFAIADSDRSVFRFYHLTIPHAPFLLNEQLEMERLPSGREGFYRHSVATTEILRSFLQHLKDIGVYDRTAIAIVSDHGGGEYGVGVKAASDLNGAENSASAVLPAAHHESGLPLILIKPLGSRGSIRLTDAPVSLGDLAATMASLVAHDHRYPGGDMLTIAPSDPRERRYLFYRFDGWTNEYLPPLEEYLVQGHSWDTKSWSRTGRVFDGKAISPAPALVATKALEVGDRIDFSRSGTSRLFTGEGWSGPERLGTWTTGPRATLKLPLAASIDQPLVLYMKVRPFVVDDLRPEQTVRVAIGSHVLEEFKLSRSLTLRIDVPRRFLPEHRELELVLELPDAASPAELLVGIEDRKLGVYVQSLLVQSLKSYALAEAIRFVEDGDSHHVVGTGWSGQERTHRWTHGDVATLKVFLKDEPDNDLFLRLRGYGYLQGDLRHQSISVEVAGSEVATWEVRGDDWHEAEIPVGLIEHGEVNVVLRVSDPMAPCDWSDSSDCRRLGLAVQEMVLVERVPAG